MTAYRTDDRQVRRAGGSDEMKNRSTSKVILEELRRACGRSALSMRTARTYDRWARRYLRFRSNHELAEMGDVEVNAFLRQLAASGASRSTQGQALAGLRFLYRQVLHTELGEVEAIDIGGLPREAPAILSLGEFQRLIAATGGLERLIFRLIFGTGLRLQEALNLRVRDIDFADERIHVRDRNARTMRSTLLPAGITAELHRHLREVRTVHSKDLRAGYGRILIPYAMWQKNPNQARAWEWQYVFPAPRRTRDPRKGAIRRHHLSKSTVNRRLGEAASLAGIEKSISCACLRRSFAHHLVATGCEPRRVQKLLGCKSIKTVTAYSPTPVRPSSSMTSPLDLL